MRFETPAPDMPKNDRLFMMLWYAVNALNWFPASCVARSGELSGSFMYPSIIVDGDDLMILARTVYDYQNDKLASERAQCGHHDANLLTFHRIRDFRALVMDIHPR